MKTKRKIVGIIGAANSGKGTAAKIFKDKGFTEFSFADSVKDSVASIFGFDRKLLQGDTKKSREFREEENLYWSKKLGYRVTPRSLLAEFSTDIMRNKFHKDIWVDSLEKKLIGNKENIVISDVRFLNEANMLKNLGATLILAVRPNYLTADHLDVFQQLKDKDNRLNPCTDLHRSEWEWLTIPEKIIDLVVINTNLIEYKNDLLTISEAIIKDKPIKSVTKRDRYLAEVLESWRL
jgi:dephospho-CoA kinase